MDLTELFLISGLIAAWVGTTVGIMHAIGWIPPRYRRTLLALQGSTADRIAGTIRTELEVLRSPDLSLPDKITSSIQSGLAPLSASLPQLETSMRELVSFFKTQEAQIQNEVMQAKGALGGIAKAQNMGMKELAGAVIADALGPIAPVLEMALPNVYKIILKRPELAGQILEWPIVKNVLAQAQGWMAQQGMVPPAEGTG